MSNRADERARALDRARAFLRTISEKEDDAVRKAAHGDPDNPEWTAKDFRRARWLTDVKPGFAESVKRHKGIR